MPPTQSMQTPERPKNEPVGPMVGIVIIVILLLVGASYFFAQEISRRSNNSPPYIPNDAAAQK